MNSSQTMKRQTAIQTLAKHHLQKATRQERADFLLDWWTIDEFDPEFYSLSPELREEIISNEAPKDPNDIKYNPLIMMAIRHNFKGIRNLFLEQEMYRLIGQVVTIEGLAEMLKKCPCCEFRTLAERGGHDICPVCFWEDDFTNEEDRYSSPNHMTLQEGKRNFLAIGACEARLLKYVDKQAEIKYLR